LLRQSPRAFVYALLVHLALLGVLIFSLDWTSTVKPTMSRQHAPIQAVAVDAKQLESELQRKRALEERKKHEAEEQRKREEAAKQAERRKLEEEKQRQAELKRKAEQEAKRKVEAERKRQAELAAKKKAEAEKKRREEEARKQAEAEKKRREEEARKQAEAEKKRKEEEARKQAEAERKRRQEEARRKAEQELQARLAAEQEREAAQRRSAMQNMVNEYVLYIQEKVQRSWIRPPSSGSELTCMVEVRLIPSGEVIDAQIVRSSGNSAFDRSVEAAVFKASPLPVPPDPDVMEQFRSLRFEFKPGSA
jgi:colicin import membrane protein